MQNFCILVIFHHQNFVFQDVRVPVQLQRAMAAEAEAAREARAKVVAAEGEQKASLHLKEAALVLEESTSALQLRYLQVNISILDSSVQLNLIYPPNSQLVQTMLVLNWLKLQ